MKNKNNFENEVIEFLDKKGGAAKKDLVEYLQTNHPDENGYERGYSSKSLDTKLGNLVKQGVLLTIQDQEDLDRFGIKKQDGRASYYFSKTSTEIKTHLDDVIELLKSKDEINIENALVELDSYEKRYPLTPSQLDLLVENLDSENPRLDDHLLRILYKYVTDKGKEPTEKEGFVNTLKILLKKYSTTLKKPRNLRNHIITLLGYYEDDIIVQQFRKDVVDINDIDTLKDDYCNEYTSPIIEKHRTELLKFKIELQKAGIDDAAQHVGEVRQEARIVMGLVDNPFKNDIRGW